MSSTDLPEELNRPYSPLEHEEGVIQAWERSGYYGPDKCVEGGYTEDEADTFSIVLPPPNVTGVLHLGHALTISLEDAMVRYKRMRGYRTVWIPGTDHAAIATQVKAEKQLEKEDIKKQDLSREELFARIQEYALENQHTIKEQLHRIGASLDWSREAFTLDDKRERAVRTAFSQMYEDGLIYRGYRVVNWDPKERTTVSDDEVVHEESTATLYTFRYSHDFPIPIATTRPETKLGDTAVAVHPDDERYQQYIGETYEVPFAGTTLEITVIGDEEIDTTFGTGAVGVTPAHSATDWHLARKHNLPLVPVIDEAARMTVGMEGVKSAKTADAREHVVEWLRKEDLLMNEEEVEQNISTAQRTGAVIEPLPKEQWFVDVNKPFTMGATTLSGVHEGDEVTLKQLMRTAVETGDITFIPERYVTNYHRWIENLDDWCISRQIIYGHRIPVWYAKDRNGEVTETYVGVDAPEGDEWEQDPDTLDTWFSSALWTFSTLGWPDDTQDLQLYHPTSMLETGHDILFFWVARMILMSTYLRGEIPFENVYLHGTVRDAQGRTMSKSLGNGIDPMEVIQEYGTDALRMALVTGNTPGTDISVSYEKFKAHQRFTNKLWNATRFVLSHLDNDVLRDPPELTKEHAQRLDELKVFTTEITKEMDTYQLHIASDKLYNYFWHTFADEIIEETKPILQEGSEKERRSGQYLLISILRTNLTMLHPFMPFVTEQLWSYLPLKEDGGELLMVEPWPSHSAGS